MLVSWKFVRKLWIEFPSLVQMARDNNYEKAVRVKATWARKRNEMICLYLIALNLTFHFFLFVFQMALKAKLANP